MGDSSRIVIPWSDLPKELLERIAKCLDTETDVLRFRAVCNSWRSSTKPFEKFPYSTVKLPFPFDARETSHPKHHGAYFSLTERTVYRVQLPDSKEPNFWLVKIERSTDGKMRILNPVTHRQVKILPETQIPKVLNTLDFRVSEVCKAYTLQYVNPSEPNQNDEYRYARKVVLSAGVENDEYVVMAIDNSNKLWYTKSGDEKWTMLRDYNACFSFYDVVNYKGQFHGIDGWGGTWAFDSEFESTKVTYNMYYSAFKRHLVELENGELFLVEEMRDKDNINAGWGFPITTVRKPAVDIMISAIDKKEREWVETKAVNDWIIVVGDDCSFSVSTKEFEGCKGSRVFFADRYIFIRTEEEKMPHDIFGHDYDDNCDHGYTYFECNCSDNCDCCEPSDDDTDNFIASDDVKLRFSGFHGHNVGVCDYETGKTGTVLMFPEYADIFWPPPSWFSCS